MHTLLASQLTVLFMVVGRLISGFAMGCSIAKIFGRTGEGGMIGALVICSGEEPLATSVMVLPLWMILKYFKVFMPISTSVVRKRNANDRSRGNCAARNAFSG